MSVFTKIDISFLNEKVKSYWLYFIWINIISDWLDNSVFTIYDKDNNEFILKIYEWKDEYFFNNLINFHELLEDLTIHKIQFKIDNFVDWKNVIIFNKVNNNLNYNINLILEKIFIFHKCLNHSHYLKENIKKYIDYLKYETEQYYIKIGDEWYINKYKWFIDCKKLYWIFINTFNTILTLDITLNTGLIHNDLCKWNIIPNDLNWIEFIDFDGMHKNLLLKDYIIFIIRFDLFWDIEKYFFKNKKWKFYIWNEKIEYNLIKSLYLIYSINLILNMIYYIWYNIKNVNDENFYKNNNQSWQEIYKNLLKYKLI